MAGDEVNSFDIVGDSDEANVDDMAVEAVLGIIVIVALGKRNALDCGG